MIKHYDGGGGGGVKKQSQAINEVGTSKITLMLVRGFCYILNSVITRFSGTSRGGIIAVRISIHHI